ncbi:MAG: ABC transporter substrate-binding protein [Syntrophorhabdus sp.]|nr:ABC transporter substrate-binding protein [Syntrophorhabdus sp.]
MKVSGALVFLVLLLTTLCAVSHGREIVDMAGRRVTVPDRIRKVCTDWPIMMYLVYAIDPTLLAGINTPFNEDQKEYVRPSVRALPVVGGFFGQGRTANMETLFKVKPDIIIAEIWGDLALNRRSEELLAGLGIPVVYVKVDVTSDYMDAFLFLGGLLGKEKRARTLSDYGKAGFRETARVTESIPAEKRPRVYYAEGATGLFTECSTSFHGELIRLAGAKNVHTCRDGRFKVRGMEAVTLEQVMRYDPDVIVAMDRTFYANVFKDERWGGVKAVKTGRVYLSPGPFLNWFDRPPSFMRLLGLKWLTWRLYPGSYRIDMVKEAQRFYRLFLGVDMPEDRLKEALYR